MNAQEKFESMEKDVIIAEMLVALKLARSMWSDPALDERFPLTKQAVDEAIAQAQRKVAS
jgi:hypothetical protein